MDEDSYYAQFHGKSTDQLRDRLAEVEEAVRLAYKMSHEDKEALRGEAEGIKAELGLRGELWRGEVAARVVDPNDLVEIKRIARMPARERTEAEATFVNQRLRAMAEGVELGYRLQAGLQYVMDERGQAERSLAPGSLAWEMNNILREHRQRASKILRPEPVPLVEEEEKLM